jgi:hypothetical protein
MDISSVLNKHFLEFDCIYFSKNVMYVPFVMMFPQNYKSQVLMEISS